MNVNTHPAEKWRVSGWMSRNVLTLKPKSPAVDAYELMHDHRIRHVPVVDHNKIVGIVSDRDLRPLIHPGRSTPTHKLFETPVESIMSRKPVCVTPDASIQEA